jgi:anti-anti-sigma factor
MTAATPTETPLSIALQTSPRSPQRAQDDLTVSLTDLPWGFLLHVVGAACTTNLGPMDSHLTRMLACRPQRVVLDLSELTFLSSMAMGWLLRLRRDLARWNGRVIIACALPSIRESLETARLAELFELHATVADALATA